MAQRFSSDTCVQNWILNIWLRLSATPLLQVFLESAEMNTKGCSGEEAWARKTELAPSSWDSFFKNGRAIMTDITFGFCGFAVHLQTSVHVSYFFCYFSFSDNKNSAKMFLACIGEKLLIILQPDFAFIEAQKRAFRKRSILSGYSQRAGISNRE